MVMGEGLGVCVAYLYVAQFIQRYVLSIQSVLHSPLFDNATLSVCC